jgi:hypothetical protein
MAYITNIWWHIQYTILYIKKEPLIIILRKIFITPVGVIEIVGYLHRVSQNLYTCIYIFITLFGGVFIINTPYPPTSNNLQRLYRWE